MPMDRKIRSVLVGIPQLKRIAAHNLAVVNVPEMLGQLVQVLCHLQSKYLFAGELIRLHCYA